MQASNQMEAYKDLLPLTPRQLRRVFRENRWTGSTGGLAPEYLQANLVVLPREDALDFLIFCHLNPQACPVVDIVSGGETEFSLAPDSDLRTDLPKYRVFVDGKPVEEPNDVKEWWGPDSIGILLGCSVTFESALMNANIPVRHLIENKTCPMYITNIDCHQAGRFQGPLVVTMRGIPANSVPQAIEITSKMPQAHGAPVHIGDPEALGIDLNRPDFGDLPILEPGDTPVFWACGVTPQLVAEISKPKLMITHYPGAMFITDQKWEKN